MEKRRINISGASPRSSDLSYVQVVWRKPVIVVEKAPGVTKFGYNSSSESALNGS